MTGCQANRTFCSNDSLSEVTWDASGDNAHILMGYENHINTGEFDQGVIWYWPLDQVPQDLVISRAYFALDGTGLAVGNNLANGQEAVPMRVITNPKGYSSLWDQARLNDAKTAYVGASWRYWTNIGGAFSWSDAATTNAPYGKPGDLSTALWPIDSSTPRISFDATKTAMSRSTDATAIIQGMINGTIPNYGFYLDPSYGTGPVIQTASGNFTVRVGIYNHWNSNPAKRPRPRDRNGRRRGDSNPNPNSNPNSNCDTYAHTHGYTHAYPNAHTDPHTDPVAQR